MYRRYPQLFNRKIYDRVGELVQINEAYIRMSKKDLGELLTHFPYIFTIPTEKIRENLKMLNLYHFSPEYLKKIVFFLNSYHLLFISC